LFVAGAALEIGINKAIQDANCDYNPKHHIENATGEKVYGHSNNSQH